LAQCGPIREASQDEYGDDDSCFDHGDLVDVGCSDEYRYGDDDEEEGRGEHGTCEGIAGASSQSATFREVHLPSSGEVSGEVPLLAQFSTGTARMYQEAMRRGGVAAAPYFRPDLPVIASSVSGQAAKIARILDSENPATNPLEWGCATRLVTEESFSSRLSSLIPDDRGDLMLIGQQEMIMKAFTPKGYLIPWWTQSLRLSCEGAPAATSRTGIYEFCFKWQGKVIVAEPSLHTPPPFCNDYCGPDRSKERKQRLKQRQNFRFAVIFDRWRRPWPFIMAVKDIAAGGSGWIDYSDDYWENWRVDQGALESASAALATALERRE